MGLALYSYQIKRVKVSIVDTQPPARQVTIYSGWYEPTNPSDLAYARSE